MCICARIEPLMYSITSSTVECERWVNQVLSKSVSSFRSASERTVHFSTEWFLTQPDTASITQQSQAGPRSLWLNEKLKTLSVNRMTTQEEKISKSWKDKIRQDFIGMLHEHIRVNHLEMIEQHENRWFPRSGSNSEPAYHYKIREVIKTVWRCRGGWWRQAVQSHILSTSQRPSSRLSESRL